MKTTLKLLFFGCFLFLAYAYLRPRIPQGKPAVKASQPTESTPVPGPTDPMITVAGPLANYMQQTAPPAAAEPGASSEPFPGDRLVESPTGTSLNLLRKTFALKTTAKFTFEIPPHASSPQLRGSYQSFVRQGGSDSSDDAADVEFLLMNEQQYAELLHNRPVDVLFFVESSHTQQVQFGLPATFNQGARYCLVFRNRSTEETTKIVHAEFRIDF